MFQNELLWKKSTLKLFWTFCDVRLWSMGFKRK
jgi:hypothetical protein